MHEVLSKALTPLKAGAVARGFLWQPRGWEPLESRCMVDEASSSGVTEIQGLGLWSQRTKFKFQLAKEGRVRPGSSGPMRRLGPPPPGLGTPAASDS